MGYYTLKPLNKALDRVGQGIRRPNSPCWKDPPESQKLWLRLDPVHDAQWGALGRLGFAGLLLLLFEGHVEGLGFRVSLVGMRMGSKQRQATREQTHDSTRGDFGTLP